MNNILADLDDFIAPAQDCIVMENGKLKVDVEEPVYQVTIHKQQKPDLIKADAKNAAKISL